MQFKFTPDEVIGIVEPRAVRGATRQTISRLSALGPAEPGDLSFLGNRRYRPEVPTTRASIVLLPADYAGEPGADQLYLLVDNPSVALARVCGRLEQLLWPRPTPGIHPSAVVEQGAQIASTAAIGPLCVVDSGAIIGAGARLEAQVHVGRNAKIGADCWLLPGVVLAAECELGERVRLHPGVVIGSDGFGYEFVAGRHEKVPQVGRVEIASDVEIGANTTVDRARFGVTRVGEGTKIDNLVMVAHNVVIGRHCILCAQVGIAGSTVVEDYVILGGQVGVAGHVSIGKGAKAGGRAAITSSVEAGSYVNGSPAIPFLLERRIAILKQRLPDLFRRVDVIEALLEESKKTSAP